MLKHFPKLPSLLVATFREWRKDNPSLLAASIAYYSFFSIVPLAVIMTAVGSLFFGQAAATGQLTATLTQLFGERVALLIEAALASTYEQQSSAMVAAAVAILLFGATYVFVQLRNALNIIWKVDDRKKPFVKFVETRLVSLVMIASVSVLVLLWLVTSASLSTVALFSGKLLGHSAVLLEILNFILLFIVASALFAIMYKVLPSIKLDWEDVGMGAMVTAFLFAAGGHIVAFYLGKIGLASLYGVAGSMVVLLVWLYVSAQMFLFGVVFTKVFAKRHGSHRKKRLAKQQRSA